MDSSQDDASGPPVLAAELRAQRAHLGAVREALRRQAELLRLRQLESSPALPAALSTAEATIARIAETVGASEDEIDQLRTLSLTSALINSSLDADTVLAQAMDELIGLTGAERGFIVLVDAESGALHFRIARGLNPNDLKGEGVSRTLLRQVLKSGQPLVTGNAAEDPLLSTSETLARYTLRSVVCVPLRSKGAVEGAIYVDNRLKTGVFGDIDLLLLTAFANQAAVALHNARLFTRVQETIGEINRARALIENVFASIGSGVITADAGDRVLTCNAAAGAILGCAPQDAAGRRLSEVLPLSDELADRVRHVVRSGRGAAFDAQPEITGRGHLALAVRVSPLRSAEGVTQGAALVFDDLTEIEEREETLRLMTRYLPPGMVEQIQEIAGLEMGGERRDVTCVFLSACSFSAFPPGLRPAETMAMLNVYLNAATTCIHQARGIVDKYLGSGIMALFNTQLNPEPAHARAALEMALDLQHALDEVRRQLGIDPARRGDAIGIHSGVATLGNVGSLRRRSFTALGDTINLARRVYESAAPGQILITGATAERLPPAVWNALRLEARPPIQARGRQQATSLFEVFRD